MFNRSLAIVLITVVCSTRLIAQSSAHVPSFHVQVSGKGPAVILIPGLAASGEVWDATVAHLASRFECHVLTLAGFAGEPSVAPPLLDRVGRDLAAYIAQRGLNRPIVIGHSLGGTLALWLAGREPTSVGPLVIVDALPFMGGVLMPGATPDSVRPLAERIRKSIVGQSREQYEAFTRSSPVLKTMVSRERDLERVTAWSLGSDPTTVGEALYELYTTDLRPSLANIVTPTHVVGTWLAYRDFQTRDQTERVFRDQYAALKGYELVMTDSARHFVMLDDPAWFHQQLDEFLSKVSR